MQCRNCGKTILDNAQFCPHCGKENINCVVAFSGFNSKKEIDDALLDERLDFIWYLIKSKEDPYAKYKYEEFLYVKARRIRSHDKFHSTFDYIKKMSDEGDKFATFLYGKVMMISYGAVSGLFENKDKYKAGEELVREAAQMGESMAIGELGIWNYTGKKAGAIDKNFVVDKKTAFNNFLEAANRRCVKVYRYLGEIYKEGNIEGVKKNTMKSKKYLDAAMYFGIGNVENYSKEQIISSDKIIEYYGFDTKKEVKQQNLLQNIPRFKNKFSDLIKEEYEDKNIAVDIGVIVDNVEKTKQTYEQVIQGYNSAVMNEDFVFDKAFINSIKDTQLKLNDIITNNLKDIDVTEREYCRELFVRFVYKTQYVLNEWNNRRKIKCNNSKVGYFSCLTREEANRLCMNLGYSAVTRLENMLLTQNTAKLKKKFEVNETVFLGMIAQFYILESLDFWLVKKVFITRRIRKM